MFGRIGLSWIRRSPGFGGRGRRSFSSGEAESGPVGRALGVLGRNKQAIVNTIGVYIVLSYSVHNYRVQQAWDKREDEFKALHEEVDFMKRTLQNPEWLGETEKSVKASVRSKKPILGDAIGKVLKLRTEQEKVEHKQKVAQKDGGGDLGGLNQLAALVDGGSGDSKVKTASKKGVDVKIV